MDDAFDPALDDFVASERNYIHFDLPLTEEQRSSISLAPSEIIAHSFWPLLGFDAIERRAKRDDHNKIYFEEKKREIKFGSHQDAALLEAYSRSLGLKYEAFLGTTSFVRSVLAYRSDQGDNITQARDLFLEIQSRGNCIAIALDIKGFFDHIDHSELKGRIGDVLGSSLIPQSDFYIFRRMTNFEWVDSGALRERLGKRYARFGRICSSGDFRGRVRDLVQVNPNPYGIPQGTPLSGLYANISMLDFDKSIHELCKSFGGSYRRYSDDIAIIAPDGCDQVQIIDTVNSHLQSIGLKISSQKTEISIFQQKCGEQSSSKPFQYLGFTYDGSSILIRQSSLNRYYSKMHKGIRAKIRAAKENGIDRDEIFMRELFKRYTHFGKSRNFPRYAYRAARVLSAPEIRRQLRNHMKIFKNAVRHHIIEVY